MILLNPDEVSRRVGLAPQTLAKYRCEGRGPRFTRIGKRVMYPEAAVNEWLETLSEYQSTTEADSDLPAA